MKQNIFEAGWLVFIFFCLLITKLIVWNEDPISAIALIPGLIFIYVSFDWGNDSNV